MVDREYVLRTIEHLKREKEQHDTKFGGNVAHENCLPRFDLAIANLEKELSKLTEREQTTASGAAATDEPLTQP